MRRETEVSSLVAFVQRAGSVLRRVVGAPDYERYLAHVSLRHPDMRPLTRDEFARDALSRRYDRPGSRCC